MLQRDGSSHVVLGRSGHAVSDAALFQERGMQQLFAQTH
jgi:hypothetical protein